MKQIITAILVFLSLAGGELAAQQGIQFQKISFEEALDKAKAEQKLIFIDFYTVWCGPCKGMDKNVFSQPQTGEFFNKSFINLKIDAEKEGVALAKKYNVSVFPTLLFIDHKGALVYRKEGALDLPGTIDFGKKALEAVSSNYSMSQLEELFPTKQEDEEFLRMYIDKMKEYGADVTDGMEAWLKIQTEIKEADVDMMEFLLKSGDYLMSNGEGARIFEENFQEYWSIATQMEELQLKGLPYKMVENTKNRAYATKDPELMRVFINHWKKLPEGKQKNGNPMDFELDYLLMNKQYNAFKMEAAHYIDSLMASKTLEEIREEDKQVYEAYAKRLDGKPSLIGNAILKNLKKGKQAYMMMLAIEKTGYNFLRHCSSRKDYKMLLSWIAYGDTLVPEDYRMNNLKAQVFYSQGKVAEAISLKKLAIEKVEENDKIKPRLETELMQWEGEAYK